jgi:hypothetical protein
MLDPQSSVGTEFSSPGASATPWAVGKSILDDAEIFWLTTVRSTGAPHVTPLIAVWHADALWFCTGAGEQKAINLGQNPAVVLTTGCNRYGEGTDVVLEGTAERVTANADLVAIADRYRSKYGWEFSVADGGLIGDGRNAAIVFRVRPRKGFAFARGDDGSQTRWLFDSA